MKVVYLAGPYRASTEYGVHKNIQAAEQVALEVWRMGAVCICPHKNTAYFGGELPDETWLDGDRELIRRSDVVLMMDGYETSQGADAEGAFAARIHKPVLFSLDKLRKWLAALSRGRGAHTLA
jgi:hypothetical protein